MKALTELISNYFVHKKLLAAADDHRRLAQLYSNKYCYIISVGAYSSTHNLVKSYSYHLRYSRRLRKLAEHYKPHL